MINYKDLILGVIIGFNVILLYYYLNNDYTLMKKQERDICIDCIK